MQSRFFCIRRYVFVMQLFLQCAKICAHANFSISHAQSVLSHARLYSRMRENTYCNRALFGLMRKSVFRMRNLMFFACVDIVIACDNKNIACEFINYTCDGYCITCAAKPCGRQPTYFSKVWMKSLIVASVQLVRFCTWRTSLTNSSSLVANTVL